MYALRISLYRCLLLWSLLGAFGWLGSFQALAAANYIQFYNNTGSTFAGGLTWHPDGGGSVSIPSGSIAAGAYYAYNVSPAGGLPGGTVKKDSGTVTVAVVTGGTDSENPGSYSFWFTDGFGDHWRAGPYNLSGLTTYTNFYNNGSITNTNSISGDYMLIAYTNGVGWVTNSLRLGPNEFFSWNYTNDSGAIVVEVLKPGGQDTDYLPVSTTVGSSGSTTGTSSVPNNSSGTTTSADPFAGIPNRTVGSDALQEARKNAEGITKAIGAGNAEITGLLRQIATNSNNGTSTNQFVADGSQVTTNTSAFESLAGGYHSSLTNGLTAMRTNVSGLTGVVQVASLDPSFFQFNLLGQSVDLLDNDEMLWAAEWIRNLILWVSAFYIMIAVWGELKETILKIGAFQQGRSPNLGGGVGGISFQSSLLMHPICLAIIAAAIAVFVVLLYTSVTGLTSGTFSVLWLNPFASSHVFIQQAGYLISLFIPVTALIAQWVAYMLFKLAIAGGALIAQIAIRATPGLILLSFLTFEAQAQNVTIENYTGTNIMFVQADRVALISPGQSFGADLAGSIDFRDSSSNLIGSVTVPASGFVWYHCILSNGVPAAVVAMERVSLWQAVTLGARFGGILLVAMMTFWFVAILKRPQNPETVGV